MPNPSAFKVTLQYIQFNRKWNEDFWVSASDVASVVPKVNAILTPAMLFRHPACYINYVRISNPFAQRQSQILHQQIPLLTPGSIVPEVTSTAAIYRLNTSNFGVSRSIWLRGLPNASVQRRPTTGQDYPGGSLDAGVQAYYQALVDQGFGVLSLVPTDTTDNKRHPINSITVLAPPQPGTPSQVQINTPDVYVTQTPARVVLYRIPQKLFPALSGHFTIQPAVGSFIPQGYLTPLTAASYNVVGAAFRQELYRFSAFIANAVGQTNNCQFVEFDRRDTQGGPSSTRGRSRARIRRSA
jgi:hypothetical protein